MSISATSQRDEAELLDTSAAGPAAMRGGALRICSYMAGAIISALSASLLLRHLGRVNTGLYVSALALVAIVGSVSDLGLTAVGIRETTRLPPEQRWFVARDLLGLRLVVTLIGISVMAGIAWTAYSGPIAIGVALAGFGLLLQAIQDNIALPLTVSLQLGKVAGLDLARQTLTTALIVLLVLLGAGMVPLLAVSIPVGLIVLALTVTLVRTVHSLAPTFSWKRWRRLLSATLPYSVAVAASAMYFRVAILLVGALSSPTQLGYFGASFRTIEVLTVVPALLAGSAFPIFARAAQDDHERLGYALGKVFEISVIVGTWVAISIAISAPLAMSIIGGAKFQAAAPVLAYQGIGLGAMFVSLVWANGLLGLGLFRQIMIINVSALLVNALLVTLLIQGYGSRGAAIGTALAEILVAILQALVVIHRRPQLRPSLRVLPRAALAAGIGLIPLLFTGIPVILQTASSTVLFAATLLAIGGFPAELMDFIPSWSR